MKTEKFETQWGGKTLSVEIGKLAGQANGACVAQYGDTVVLATAVMSDTVREGIDFFPLMVDYEERLYAAGKIKSSRFMKREGKASDEAVVSARLIDRSIRPFFNDKLRNDIQVVNTIFSVDGENDSDIPSLIATAATLTISDIPWDGPIVGIRVGLVPSETPTNPDLPGEFVVNPTFEARTKSLLDLVIAGTPEKVVMIEASANEVPENIMIQAIEFGKKHLIEPLKLIEEMQKKVGKPKRAIEEAPSSDEEVKEKEEKQMILEKTREYVVSKINKVLFENPKASKLERLEAIELLQEDVGNHLKELNIGKEKRKIGKNAVYDLVEEAVSRKIIEEGKRVDGRALDEIRPISSEVGILPRTHGSALFARGETQILSTVTLGAPSEEQMLEGMEVSAKKRYFHHYNFPPYSVGETAPLRGPGRREIGHGALAEKAILPVLPDKEKFPYTIRVVSEVLSSNGSSSMGSTCASSLALMDAGVPIKSTVAGIAMGMASDKKGNYKIITDLQDLEDGKGGMDFKITGTKIGITAIQLDTKTKGLTPQMVEKTFAQGKEARASLIEKMEKTIASPRPELSPYAPRLITFMINPERIRDVIGPGGKVINEIIAQTGVTIDIEDSGQVTICSASAESLNKAVEWVKNLTREVKVGEIFQGKVTRILDFGAFVEILPKQEGMVHISELAPYRVEKVTDVVKVGDVIPVKVIEIDPMGRINLSLKQAQGHPPSPPRERRERDDRGPRDRRRPHDSRRR
jgi:polyribonucleotide nucleotidyltransferase